MPTISLDPVKKAADLPAECGCAKPFSGVHLIDAVSQTGGWRAMPKPPSQHLNRRRRYPMAAAIGSAL
jgi:hypothetical protein